MTNSKKGKGFSTNWKEKLKRLVADKDQQEVLTVIEEVFNAVINNPSQLKINLN